MARRRPPLDPPPKPKPAELRAREESYWAKLRPRGSKHDPSRPSPREIRRREKAFWEGVVYNHIHLTAEWAGWRMAGRYLVSPDGDRITPERLRGILFREEGRSHIEKARQQREGTKATATLYTLPAREKFDGCS